MTAQTGDPFDVIVVGAGIAGLCCAGELAASGARPLLVAETKEVGFSLRPHVINGNRGIMQLPTVQIGWGGGWWLSVVRKLNVPVSIPMGIGPAPYAATVQGNPELLSVPQCLPSASSVVRTFRDLFPLLQDADTSGLERALHAGLNIPYEELCQLDRVLLTEWIADQKVDEVSEFILLILAAMGIVSSPNFCRDNASVYGAFASVRTLFGEGAFAYPYPDPREGLAVPIAEAIERSGGEVWRGRRVEEILVENGRVVGVALVDGTEVRAPNVALACGNSRIPDILKPLPPEVEGPIEASERNAHQDFHAFAVLDAEATTLDANSWVGQLSLDPNASLKWWCPVSRIVPWLARPAKQLVVAGVAIPVDDVAKQGGEDAIFASLHDSVECSYPGYQQSVEKVETLKHKPGHLWYDNLTTAPKLPPTERISAGIVVCQRSQSHLRRLHGGRRELRGHRSARDLG